MSIESAKAYVAKLKTDEGFANKVKAFPNAEERLAFVKESGFDFTPEEIKQVDEELSDSELDMVAGGDHWCENAFCWTFGC
ncbi:bacteriocin propeptide, TIGR03798 family [Desulfosporosinus orientis DSM 765]|uniref:Bacteriocin propeptide, TIGR03798 family n=1 Tax=Desulfosporosinus orientis (strain ATCC 19365 / DSM 765 / NCIMB 8382 / VKM B-1628 / Singapore I) TaxID=768706 RepID=G7W9B1_DESOD|nr:Nif11-like leader peptide family natural product precursor [Desulfosporosinus orientis]AET69248.1 bacteriocin propeptide, TIGR03798 family [Desulfosporosinus orientis DSM 765]